MSRKTLAKSVVGDIARVARELGKTPSKKEYLERGKFSETQINLALSSWSMGLRAAGFTPVVELKPGPPEEKREPKVLILDIELLPMLVFTWEPWEQNIAPNQVVEDWSIASWAAKWRGSPEVFYQDMRHENNVRDDAKILPRLWKLMDEADVIVGQNSRKFDEKKLNARFEEVGLGSPSPYQHADTKVMAKRRFGFSYNSLEWLCRVLKVKYKKQKSKKFIGMDLWVECYRGNREAWEEMEVYNKYDVLATEECFEKLAPWGTPGVNLNLFYSDAVYRCQCGKSDFQKRGFNVSAAGKFQRYQCRSCGAWHSAKGATNNLMSEAKKLSLKTPRG